MTDVTLPGIKMAWFTQDGERGVVKSSPPRVSPLHINWLNSCKLPSMGYTGNLITRDQ